VISNDEDPDQAALAAIPNVPSKKLDCRYAGQAWICGMPRSVRTDSNGNIKASPLRAASDRPKLASAYLIPSTAVRARQSPSSIA